jgi:eukaryotic-like serine/threonine-protein kinase
MGISRIGRYEVEKELGHGAMATVYKAVDPIIGRVVAIKTIRLEQGFGLEAEELRQRLYREAQSAGNLNHPNIVTIYDIGEEGDLSYIAMEFVEGETLEGWMQKNRILPVEQTVAIIEQIAAGLDFAGARGITHRDIKPGNVLLTADGRAKIADFGIAKFSTSKMTQTGMIMGTPAYMSPEQALGNPLDGRSDIFSLGVIFYEMLTGERPFSGSNSTTIIYKIVHEAVVPPRNLNVTIHAGIDSIVQRMLAKNPDERYQSCGEVVQDLHNYAALSPRVSSKRKAATAAGPAPAAAPAAAGGNKAVLYALIGVLVIVLGGVGYYFFQQSQRAPAPVQTQTVPAAPKTAAPVPLVQRPAVQQVERTVASAPAVPPQKTQSVPTKESVAPEKPGQAQIQIEYGGSASYSASIYDGGKYLDEIKGSSKSIAIQAGEHSLRIVSDEVFLNNNLGAKKLIAGDVQSVTLPGVGSAYVEVPNDAYDGCEISVNGKRLPTPYPAQIQKLAAGNHKINFRWNSGKYAGKEFSSQVDTQENHHYRVRGEPQSDRVIVQQLR